MTTQSPDQSDSQSQVSVLLGQIATKYFEHGQNAQSRCKMAILEYISLTQSPAPSKEMEERIQSIVARVFSGSFGYKPLLRQDMVQVLSEFAAEREAEVATLRAELADRWRDITANEQQTQRLLNDIENLRAEIAELKARP